MKLGIIADKDFKKYLDEYDIKYETQTFPTNHEGIAFCLSQIELLNLLLNSTIALIISVFSPFLTDAIKKYIRKTKKEVTVHVNDTTYTINPTNINIQIDLLSQEMDGDK